MKKLLLIFLVVLSLMFAVSGEETQELTVGKYNVTGKKLEIIGDSIHIPAEETTTISWKADEGEVCEGSCLVRIKGFECVLSFQQKNCEGHETKDNYGLCKGLGKDKICLSVNPNDPEVCDFEYDFGKNTGLCYSLRELVFYVTDKEFTFAGQEVSVMDKGFVKVSGGKLGGKNFKYGDIEVQFGKISAYPGGIIASKGANLKYAGLEFQGNWAYDYELCFEEKSCIKQGSYIFLDKNNQRFYAQGMADGGPRIEFTEDNPFLSMSKSASFKIKELIDSSLEIQQREGLVPYVELKTAGGASIKNGMIEFRVSKEGVWIPPAKSREDSVPMSLRFLDDKGDDVLFEEEVYGVGDSQKGDSQKLLITAYNELSVLPLDATEGILDEKLMQMRGLSGTRISETLSYNTQVYDLTRLKSEYSDKLPNLKSVEGFTSAQIKQLMNMLDRIPKRLTSQLRGLRFISDEESAELGSEHAAAFADARGNILLTKSGITESILIHELTHTYQFAVDPKKKESMKKYDAIAEEVFEIYEKDPEDPRIRDLEEQAEEIFEDEYDIAEPPKLMQNWVACNADKYPKMKEANLDRSGYCTDKLTAGIIGIMWSDRGITESMYGVMRPYGCTNAYEDMSTFVEAVVKWPAGVRKVVECNPPKVPDWRVYVCKVNLLKNDGLIDPVQYSSIFPKESRACIERGIV